MDSYEISESKPKNRQSLTSWVLIMVITLWSIYLLWTVIMRYLIFPQNSCQGLPGLGCYFLGFVLSIIVLVATPISLWILKKRNKRKFQTISYFIVSLYLLISIVAPIGEKKYLDERGAFFDEKGITGAFHIKQCDNISNRSRVSLSTSNLFKGAWYSCIKQRVIANSDYVRCTLLEPEVESVNPVDYKQIIKRACDKARQENIAEGRFQSDLTIYSCLDKTYDPSPYQYINHHWCLQRFTVSDDLIDDCKIVFNQSHDGLRGLMEYRAKRFGNGEHYCEYLANNVIDEKY